MSELLVEHRFTCPYCWESITMVLDLSISAQQYIEDCEVCCRPIALTVKAMDGELVECAADTSD